jgi:hypothetical protein
LGIRDWGLGIRFVAFLHRWLGIAGCLLFLAWFASGIVMMYARMPELSPAERLARLPVIGSVHLRVSPGAAAEKFHLAPRQVKLAILQGRPAYRFVDRGRWTVVFADTGEAFAGFAPEEALAEARTFAPEHAATLHYDGRLTEPDQWTLQTRALLPMHRIGLGDADGTTIYLSDLTGEVVMKTTASLRRIAYAGAVLHWLYFTPFRTHSALWNESIVWLSLAGSVMCLLGLVWGAYVGLRSPYRGWMRWHHYAGLAFGVVSFTWVFSGLLSMDPWNWHPSTAPTAAQRDAFSGGPLRLDDLPMVFGDVVHEIEWGQFGGRPFAVADGERGLQVPREELIAAASAAMPGIPIADRTLLQHYDSYYYGRDGALPLPVLRIQFADPVSTWLYIDPTRGVILRKEERLTRVNRWLYHGLHSLDFPGLYNRRPLWDVVVICLSLGGIASAATALLPAWRRLRRHAKRLYT